MLSDLNTNVPHTTAVKSQALQLLSGVLNDAIATHVFQLEHFPCAFGTSCIKIVKSSMVNGKLSTGHIPENGLNFHHDANEERKMCGPFSFPKRNQFEFCVDLCH